MRSDFDLSDLEDGFARAESFQSSQERRSASAQGQDVAHTDGSRTRAGGGARGRGRYDRRHHDDGPTGSSATDASRTATSLTAPSTTAGLMEALAVAIFAATVAETSVASAARSLGQLGETTSPTAEPDQSTSPAERSCRVVRLLPPSPMDIARIQRWTLDRVKLRDSTATSRLRRRCHHRPDPTPPAPHSESDWSSSSWHSQAPKAHFVQPGQFQSLVSSD